MMRGNQLRKRLNDSIFFMLDSADLRKGMTVGKTCKAISSRFVGCESATFLARHSSKSRVKLAMNSGLLRYYPLKERKRRAVR